MKTKYSLIIFGVGTIVLHLLSFNFFPINYEFTFSEGSKFFDLFEKKYSDFYFQNQANTIFYSLIINLIDRITLDFFDNLMIARLISFTSYIFLIYGLLYNFRLFRIKKTLYSLIIIFFLFNPIIWILSFRSSPDLISFSLGFYSSSLLLYKYKNIFIKKISLILLGISITLKPFACIYLLYLIIFIDGKPSIKILKKYFIDFIILIIIPITYYVSVKYHFGFYLLSDSFYSDHAIKKNLLNILQNLVGYMCFLSIFIFPLSLSLQIKLNYKIFLSYIFLIFFGVYQFNFFELGELDFCFFGLYLNNNILLIISFSLLFFFFLKILEIIKHKEEIKINIKLITVIIFFLIMLSLSKPVQRYLIFILPIIIFLIIKNSEVKKIKLLLIIGICIYLPINLMSFLNFYSKSKFYNQIFLILKSNDIEKVTDFKTLDHTLGFLYLDNKSEKKFYIAREPRNYFLKFEDKFFGLKRIYYLNYLN